MPNVPNSARRCCLFIFIALSYFTAGKLGLLLAIPPGFSSAIFPSSGIALAALLLCGQRQWPGVFLGSLVLNLTTMDSLFSPMSHAGLTACCIASGSTLQALAGGALIRRFVGFPNDLTEQFSILKFYILGGPVSCLISASIGLTTLYLSGVVTPQSIPFNWTNWWIGDMIGVFITVPVIFCFFAHPRELWRRRVSSVLPLLCFSFSAVVLLFFTVSTWEIYQQRDEFKDITNTISTSMRNKMQLYSSLLESNERFVSSSSQLSRAQFSIFNAPLIAHYPGIQAMSWLPLIKAADRLKLESQAQQEGFPGFQLRQRDTHNQMVPVTRRDDYVPILFVEPYLSNEAVFGFDLSSNAQRLAALSQARDTGAEVATERIELIQGGEHKAGILLIKAVYDSGAELQTVAQRRSHLRGYVSAVLRMNTIFSELDTELAQKNISLQVIDETTETLKLDPDAHQDMLFQLADWNSTLATVGIGQKVSVPVGGRSWRLEFLPLPNYLVAHRSMQAWAILAGGLFFTGFLGFILLFITGQSEKVQREVKDRTKELSIIIDNVVDGILTVDGEGLIRSFNPAAAAIFGFAEQDVIGCSLSMLLSDAHSEEQLKFIKDSSRIEGSITLLARVLEGQRADGRLFPLEFAMSRSVQADRPMFVAVVRDITERTRIERMKNEFVSTVSHELRTPLTSIGGVLSLVGGGVLGEVSDAAKKMIEMANKNCQRLTTLINDLLDIDKLIAGKMVLNLEVQPLMPLIQQALDSISAYGKQYNVTFQLISQEKVQVQVNADRIVQVLNNFLSNAAKFSPSGARIDVAVRRITKNDNQFVRVEVIDYGAGIPEEFHPRVFQKFSQADSSDTKQKGGTGLGLAISKELIERMNGIVGFDSSAGQGSCFYFDLPLLVVY